MGIKLTGTFSELQKATIASAAITIGVALANVGGGTADQAFSSAFGTKSKPFSITLDTTNVCGCWGKTTGASSIILYQYDYQWADKEHTSYKLDANGLPQKFDTSISSRLVAHEFGHAFNNNIGGLGVSTLGSTTIKTANGAYVEGNELDVNGNTVWNRTNDGYKSDWFPDQQHPLKYDAAGNTAGEDFGDMFLNWTYNSFDTNPAGVARYDWMSAHMSGTGDLPGWVK